MNRRNFLKILPGLMAAKAIAKELPPLVSAPVDVSKGLWYYLQHGNTFIYSAGSFSLEDFKKAIGDLFYSKHEHYIEQKWG